MAGTHTYEESKKMVMRGLILLAIVTLVEVGVSLFGKGHLFGIEPGKVLQYVTAIIIILLSLYKAYFIIYEFMHMRYEAKGLAISILLPTILLVWAIIAMLQEGNSWGKSRELIKEKNELPATTDEVGMQQNVINLEEVMG